jgi:hypothetical protein
MHIVLALYIASFIRFYWTSRKTTKVKSPLSGAMGEVCECSKNETINAPIIGIEHSAATANHTHDKNVFVFYFVFIPERFGHWTWLVTVQLKDLKATGLLEVASLNVIAATSLTSPTADEDMMSLTRIVKEIAGSSATVTPRYENRYEYWGLHSMWEKAMSQNPQQRKDSIFLYMHSRGMVKHGAMTEERRAETDLPLFKHVVEPWRDALHRFKTVPQLDKAGFVMSHGGYCMFNFFWVRSSYVARLEAPAERPTDHRVQGGGPPASKMSEVNRYYYEYWLAFTTDQNPSALNGWSMVLDEFKLGVCFMKNGIQDAWKRDNKTRLSDDGVFNCPH